MGRRLRKHMTNKVPNQHVHPHSLSRIFAIEKKKKKNHVKLFCLAPTHSSTGPAYDFFFFFFLNTRTRYARTIA